MIGAKHFKSETSEVVKLCNINHDNLEACKDSRRLFLPQIKDFFEEAIEQLDPANQIEKQYHLINRTDWSWKALRLLAKRSAFYFMQNQNVKTISEYLEAICNKLSKELPINSNENPTNTNEMDNMPINEEETVQITDDSIAAQSNQQSSGILNNTKAKDNFNNLVNEEKLVKIKQEFQVDEDDSQSSIGSMNQFSNLNSNNTISTSLIQESNSGIINEEIMNTLSDMIVCSQQWKRFALQLSMDEDTITFIEADLTDIREQCKKILLLWKVRLIIIFE